MKLQTSTIYKHLHKLRKLRKIIMQLRYSTITRAHHNELYQKDTLLYRRMGLSLRNNEAEQ